MPTETDAFRNGCLQKWMPTEMDADRNGCLQKWMPTEMDADRNGCQFLLQMVSTHCYFEYINYVYLPSTTSSNSF